MVIRILWNVVHSYEEPANRLAEQIQFYEEKIIRRDTSQQQVENLYYLKRKTTIALKLLQFLNAPVNRLPVSEENEAALEDVRDHHLQVTTLYASALDDINNLMNLYLSVSSHKTNEVVKLLTLVSVFFMPLTFIAGIYGMNFKYMPELEHPWGYAAVWILMGVVVLILYRWIKTKKWL
jgi:magnesium transporter